MLLAILLILLQTGTTDLQILLTTEFSERRQILLWIAFFASFAVKVPMVPVHIWLPEAHVEAPTAGSVILAGILFKIFHTHVSRGDTLFHSFHLYSKRDCYNIYFLDHFKTDRS